MSGPVDVLAVMDDAFSELRRIDGYGSGACSVAADRLDQARAAVSELIEAGNAWCDLMPGLAGGPEFDRLTAAHANVVSAP